MKNKKMILRFAVIAIAVICTVCACFQKQPEEEENDFKVSPAEDGKSLMVSRYLGKKQAVTIPARIYKLPVTQIRKEAFKDKDLVNVTIANSVIDIGDMAFHNNMLINVGIGSGVKTIGEGAFSDNLLISITIPSGVTVIGDAAFYKNRLAGINIPGSVTTIGNNAFAGNKLTTVTIPANVSAIGNAPFLSCPDLTAINVNSGNKFYSSSDGVLYNKDLTELIQWPNGKTSEPVIPYSVTTIKSNAFAGSELTSVTIPDGVTTIESEAFMDNQLTSVVIGNGVTKIAENAFLNNKLASITLPSSVTAVGNGAFLKNPLLSVTIGANVTFDTSYYNYSIGYNFEYYYRNTGKREGTYTRPNVNSYDWSRKN
jgi:hypothetical protein